LGFLALPPIYIYWGHEAQKFTEAIPGWIDTHVDKWNKARADLLSKAIKPLEHIPVVGKAAQGLAWMDGKMNEFTGGIVKGAGSMVGGIANMVTHPVETASGLYAMAEHMPIMGGLVPNPLKLAHAGTDIIFSGADPKTRLESVLNPAKSMEEDAKFGKALLDGFIEPYKKSWSGGKYFEVAGRATFDIGSMFIGAGEANAAIKGGTAASKAANVAGKLDKAADVANGVDKAADAGKVAKGADEVAETAGKVSKVEKKGPNQLTEERKALSNQKSGRPRQSAVKDARLSRTKITDDLTGLTQQGNRIADGIKSGKVKVNVLSDELFDRAYALKGGWGSSPQAFALKEQIYVRRESPSLLSDIIHEGTHALDSYHKTVTVPYGHNPYPWEKRAFFYERQFQVAGDGAVEFETIQEMLDFIYKAY
jgi:hypothetical protein